jgi:hypothetical protein
MIVAVFIVVVTPAILTIVVVEEPQRARPLLKRKPKLFRQLFEKAKN